MHKTDFEINIENWQKVKLDTPVEKFPAWMIDNIRQYAEKRGYTTKESLPLIQAKKGIPLADLRIIFDGIMK